MVMNKVSIRHFIKNRSQILMSFIGLVLGWFCFLAISLYLFNELTYDQFHEKHKRIYRVTHNEKAGEIPGIRHLATVGPPMGPALKQTFSEVEEAVRLRYSPDWIVRLGDNQHYENGVWYADPSLFTVFDFKFVDGNKEDAFALLNNVVITDEIAKKYFGNVQDASGRIITMNNEEWKVSGVIEIPENSHIHFDFLLPFEKFTVPFGYPVTLDSWGWISFHTYILLKDNTSPEVLEEQLPQLVKQHWDGDRARKFKLQLQPLDDIYLGDVKNELIASGNKTYLMVLGTSGLLILLVASFNFNNLFTIISMSRAREIGIRKLLGSERSKLKLGIQADAVFLVAGALILAVGLFPILSSFLPFGASINVVPSDMLIKGIAVVTALAVTIGLIAGIYPSRLLVRADFQRLLKGSFKVSRAGVMLRRTMLLAQFLVSVALMSCVFIIGNQINFLETKDLGFAKNELLLLRVPGEELAGNFDPLRNKLLTHPSITGVSIGGGRMDGDNGNVPIQTETTEEGGIPMAIDAVTFDFYRTIGIKLLAGHEFDRDLPADTLAGVLINESAAQVFGWDADEAIGNKIKVGEIVLDGTIIGVIPDFHFGSLHSVVQPLVVYYPRTRLQDVYVRYNTNDIPSLIGDVSQTWSATFPHLPMDYVFLNSHLETLYSKDKDFSFIFRFFALVAILIACSGLYGLISQDIFYRIKEIGIRKVFGANTWMIIKLLLRSFVAIVLIATILSVPLAVYFMNKWLSQFAYHIYIPWYGFALSAVLVLMIAIGTVITMTLQAAKVNPTRLLRAE